MCVKSWFFEPRPPTTDPPSSVRRPHRRESSLLVVQSDDPHFASIHQSSQYMRVEVDLSLLAGAAATVVAAYAVQRYLLAKQDLAKVISADALKALTCEGRAFAPATPTADSLAAGKTENGASLRTGPSVLQRAQFNALWFEVRDKKPA